MKGVAIGELVAPALFFFLKIAWLFSVSPISVFNIFFCSISIPKHAPLPLPTHLGFGDGFISNLQIGLRRICILIQSFPAFQHVITCI